MESVSTRLDDETARLIRETADKRGESMAEILREYIEKGIDYDELQRENDRLRAEKRTLINDREERTDLVEYVEQERDLQRRQEERKNAPVWRRAKWWVFGREE